MHLNEAEQPTVADTHDKHSTPVHSSISNVHPHMLMQHDKTITQHKQTSTYGVLNLSVTHDNHMQQHSSCVQLAMRAFCSRMH
jgi:hypothetical protein